MSTFAHNVRSVHGEKGVQWLAHLPSLLHRIQEAWGLTDLTPLPNLSHNYVARGLQGTTSVVLKLGLAAQLRRHL